MNQNIQRLIFFLFALSFCPDLMATHAKSAEIIYKHIEGYTYEVSIITITYSPSPADRPELPINWGDGTTAILERQTMIDLENTVRKNYYVGQHTFPGEGSYILSMEDPNRNYGIVNIPNSVNVPLYIESLLIIDNETGPNDSPEFVIDAYSNVIVNTIFHFNCGAIEWDGDYLTYELVACKGQNGNPIAGYQYPGATNEFSIDSENGQILWDSPFVQGEFIIAVKITEWRNEIMKGSVTREFQFTVDALPLEPVYIESVEDTSFYYDQELSFNATASSTEGSLISMSAYGYPFLVENQPATFDSISGNGSCSSTLVWETNKLFARSQPYYIYLMANNLGTGYTNKTAIVKVVEINVNLYADIGESSTFREGNISMNSLVKNQLKINFKQVFENDITIRIYSLSGTLMAQFEKSLIENNTIKLNLPELEKSIYIVSISAGNKSILSRKIYKN